MNLAAVGMSLSIESSSCGPKRKATADSHITVPSETFREMPIYSGRGRNTDVRARVLAMKLLVEKHCNGEERNAAEPAAIAQRCDRVAADVHRSDGVDA